MKTVQSKQFDPPTLAVFTLFQTNGRGQGNHLWISEPGKNLAFTIAIPLGIGTDLVLLNKSLTYTVCQFIQPFLKEEVVIKWPNDIYCLNKKIAGLLFQIQSIESLKYLVLGIGINVEQTNWSAELPNAASLKDFGASNLNLFNLAESLCSDLISSIDSINEVAIHQLFRKKLMNVNQTIRILHADSNQISEVHLLDVDKFGRLQVLTTTGENLTFHHGQVYIQL